MFRYKVFYQINLFSKWGQTSNYVHETEEAALIEAESFMDNWPYKSEITMAIMMY